MAESRWKDNIVSACVWLMRNAEKGSPLGFCRSARLLNADDYASVFRRSKRLSSDSWTVLVHRKKSQTPRLGLAIAKKRARKAVDRNRLKRIARESFRVQQHILTGKDIVVLNRDSAANADSKMLRLDLDCLMGKAATI